MTGINYPDPDTFDPFEGEDADPDQLEDEEDLDDYF